MSGADPKRTSPGLHVSYLARSEDVGSARGANNKSRTHSALFLKFFLEVIFEFLVRKIPGRRKNFRDIHILLAVARPFAPDPVSRLQKNSNNIAVSPYFPQLAHYVESRHRIARKYY